MTDKEKAVVMAHTGICMLTGEKFSIFHKYIEELMGRPVFTHELANAETVNQIKEKSKEDFLELCKDEFVPESCEDYISRKDAIDKLKVAYWDKDLQSAKDDPCVIDAMTDWAIRQIKALPDVRPKSPASGDHISREALRSEIQNLRKWSLLKRDCHVGVGLLYEDVMFEIKSSPSVQPVQKIGYWKNHTTCSECNWSMYDDVCDSDWIVGFPYCPNCGSKMVESQAESGKVTG